MSLTAVGCDTIYKMKSQPLEIKIGPTISEVVRVEGVSSVFPDIVSITTTMKNQNTERDIMVIFFTKKDDLLKFSESLLGERNKSLNHIKSKIDSNKSRAYTIRSIDTSTSVLHVKNISIFREGLWIAFFSVSSENFLNVVLEFKRIGINEIPKTNAVDLH